jgi:hypothetical protein
MNSSRMPLDVVITFAITLVVGVIITYLWNLARHGAGTVDWETSFPLAIILGIALPLVHALERRTAGR